MTWKEFDCDAPSREGTACQAVSELRIAARKIASSGPRPAQHPASLPSTTTLGRLRIPCCFAPRCDVCLMHVVNFDVVVRARNAFDQIHRLIAHRATGGENLNLSALTLGHCFIFLSKSQL